MYKNQIKKNMIKKLIIVTAVICSVLLLSGCTEKNGDKADSSTYFSFEEDMQGWKVNGTDLDSPPINWTVERSDELASNGSYAVKLYLENFNDAGKIWMEKYFDAEANSIYEVKIRYKFATSDFGEFNLFNIITTVLGREFTGRDDLNYEGDTGHHSDAEGYMWLEKEFEYIVNTDDSGKIYINIGVWGSWETTRSYYIDDLNISFEKLEQIQDYPDISGDWKLKNYNWEGNLTSEENITIVQEKGDIEFQLELGLLVKGTIIKNHVENAYKDSEYIIKSGDIRGLGIDTIYIINESYMITELPLCESCNPSVFIKIE